MPTAATRFADFATSLSYDDIPGDVSEAAKLHLLDTIGCALAAQGVGLAGEGRDFMADQGGRGEATAIGLADRMPAAAAAFANGMLAHGLDFDDTHSDSMTHVTAVIAPAALAAAEAQGAAGEDLVTALVAGSEIVTRIGMEVTGRFHARGFHATAVCGVFGGAAAAARLAGASAATTASALGIAGSFAGGLFVYLDEGTATKPVHPAWAAHGAVLAAALAGRGAEGPTTVIEGRFGLYQAFIDAEPGSIDLQEQTADLGSRWETPRIAYKPFPVCHFIHGSLGATASLMPEIDVEQIESIEVSVPAPAVPIVLEPVAAKFAPRTDYDAKFSLQYCTAALLLTGKVDVGTFSEPTLCDGRIAELARKVSYVVRDYATWPAAFPGGVRITLRSGRVLEADQPHQLGAPENPMSRDQIVDKFRANAMLTLAEVDVDALESSLLGLEDHTDIGSALEPLRRARAAVGAAAT
jgi:2-methylcitrate dehydratase PrpD